MIGHEPLKTSTATPPALRRGLAPRCAILLFALALLSITPSLTAQGMPPGVALPNEDPVSVYLEAIQKAQSEGGPYALELVDLYFGYAQSLLEIGDLENARDAFHRTVTVTRVNSGPNSLEQSDYLFSIADIESRLGNLEKSIAVLESIYHIHATEYGEDDPAMLPVVEQLAAWYAEAKPLRGPLLGTSDLLNRGYLADRVAALSESAFGLGDSRTAMRYREAGQVHFRTILHILQTTEAPNPELVINSDSKGSQVNFKYAMGNQFKAGEAAYERAIESWRQNPEATPLDRAEAMAQLGDWFLALKHFRAAERQYERAYARLAEVDGSPELADRYLGDPAPLRFLNPAEKFLRDLDAPIPEEGLQVGMAVSRNGRLFDIQFINAPPGEFKDELENFRNRLENTRFRPAVVNGKVGKTDYFVWKPVLQKPNIAARDG